MMFHIDEILPFSNVAAALDELRNKREDAAYL